MAELGSVTSTALTGEDTPTFKYSPKEQEVIDRVANTGDTVEALKGEVSELKALLTQFLTDQKRTQADTGKVQETVEKTEAAKVDPEEKAEEAKPTTTKTTKAKAKE